MTDVLTIEQRQLNMRSIKSKDTKPEIILRKALFAEGFRYRLHRKDLPGKPDLVFPRYNAVIFVHGCFWHRHGCKYTSTPSTRVDFWEKKFRENVERDRKNVDELMQMGWRVYIVWECAIKKTGAERLRIINSVKNFIKENHSTTNLLHTEENIFLYIFEDH